MGTIREKRRLEQWLRAMKCFDGFRSVADARFWKGLERASMAQVTLSKHSLGGLGSLETYS